MELHAIDRGQAFDFGKTSAAYAAYRDIYPPVLYDRLRALGVAADGTDWLDLGTGTRVLPKNLYNSKANITGVDVSAEQIAAGSRGPRPADHVSGLPRRSDRPAGPQL